MKEAVEYVEPWTAVGKYAQNLINELQREVTEQHPLCGRKVRAIAQRTDCDDVLFECEGEHPTLAVVRLTWSGKPESDSRWPHTRFFGSFDAWKDAMMQDHREFVGE